MPGKLKCVRIVCALAGLLVVLAGTAQGNWAETFNNNTFDLTTWKFLVYPDVTKTFTPEIKPDPNGSDYLSFTETSSAGVGGSAFGAGFGSEEVFNDVRIGAVVNVVGDASHNYCGLAGRTSYFIDDGSVSGAPGFFATQTYVLQINWEDGPANLRIDVQKVINMQNIMQNEVALGLDVLVPGLDNARSYYAELDILGSDPTYVTGYLYDHKGGTLVAKTATMVDTSGNDPWEEEGAGDAPFLKGISGIFGQNEHEEPAGYYVTFDDVSSLSDGPAAVNPSPADGATDVPTNVTLSWVEAAFATGRELWIGKPGAMQKVDPAPTGTTYTPGNLEMGQTYEWRVDQVGPSGTVTGHTWTFTVADYLTVDDFESYTNDDALRSVWVDNIGEPGVEYVFLSTGENKAMRFEFQNQYEPYFTEVTRTFVNPQDWTAQSVETLSLSFVGEHENMEHLMYLRLEDASGQSVRVEHPFTYACQSDSWRQWSIALAQFNDGGVDLTAVKKITIGLGNGTNSGQPEGDRDHIYIDQIVLNPAAPSAD
jgi:hypothetical protein